MRCSVQPFLHVVQYARARDEYASVCGDDSRKVLADICQWAVLYNKRTGERLRTGNQLLCWCPLSMNDHTRARARRHPLSFADAATQPTHICIMRRRA